MNKERKILVFSTKGNQKTEIVTDVQSWGELKALVSAQGYDLESLSAIENITRTSLEHKDAVLPRSPFTLFLKPKKTKSGATSLNLDGMSHAELKAQVTSDEIKDFLKNKSKGVNWTRLSSKALRKGLKSWFETVAVSTSSSPVGEVEVTENEVTDKAQEVTASVQLIQEQAGIALSKMADLVATIGNLVAPGDNEQEQLEALLAEAKEISEGWN